MLVERGLADTIDDARRAIMAGEVSTAGRRVEKAGELLLADAPLQTKQPPRFVSRGGFKLERGLDAFSIDPAGRVCLDAGCSTGGFSDCLLQRGARLIYAVDVGYGQLAWTVRNDDRVSVRERTNVRSLAAGELQPMPELIVADLAFVSLAAALPAMAGVAAPAADFVLLVKPQFELPRTKIADGVVRDPQLHREAVERVVHTANGLGLAGLGVVESPLRGPDGNTEFLAAFRR